MKKLIYSSLVMVVLGVSFVFASGVNQAEIDRVTGPGVGLKESDYTERIYAYGSLITGITGNEVVEANALDHAPVAVESTIKNPINNYAIDMGPTSNYYVANYVLHNTNDNGPGKGLVTNLFASSQIYGGGPGMEIEEAMVSAMNGTEDVSKKIEYAGPGAGINYVSNGEGPTVSNVVVSPSDYIAIINLTPKEASVDVINRKKNKTNINK